MPFVTILWSMIASACVTLAAIHCLVWWFHRASRDRLVFSLMALATAGMAFAEIPMMKATSPEMFATALRWQHLPVWVNFLAIVVFVRLHLGTGRLWLGWLAVGLRGISLILNFTVGQNLNYFHVTGLREISYLGDRIWLPQGVSNPCMLLGQLALLLLLIFVTDATISAWRGGKKQRAILGGGSIVFFVLAGTLQAVLSHWHLVDLPAVASLYFLGMIVVMAFELSLETLRAGRLAEDLRATEEGKRREVAHLGRVTTLGELSGSLAHEMNQPLGIILSNAQAAQRLLSKEKPDLEKVGLILGDIVDEDLRAGEVIRRMQAFLKRGEVSHQKLDLNDVTGEVLQLLRNELREREVTVTQELAGDLPEVSADRVQLQQVLLNLMLNACEAMKENPADARQLRIVTTSDGKSLHLSVADAGSGLGEDAEVIFQPFYTTKEQGLGMGLAICRSIVKAHHGQLWAEPNPAGGAIFHLVLPLLEVAA